MSALDGFFNKGFFRAAKCKTLLKLTIPRIKLLRNRRELQIRQMRKEIAKLLQSGQEATARIRVEHIIREENMMAAQEILELFCELITVRLPIIEVQRECPLDLKEAISTICFAAPRCSDLPELQQVQMQFAAKYGKEFVGAASELLPDCGVNRQIIELLSIRAPPVDVKMKLLKAIAEEHDVDWDPADTESEFYKPPEDLLNGPTAFISGSVLPLPKEKHSESLPSPPTKHIHEQEDEPDIDFESFGLPDVPRASVIATPSVMVGHDVSTATAPKATSSPTVLPSDVELDRENLSGLHALPTVTVDVRETPKQFVPFVSPLPSSVFPSHVTPPQAAPSFSIPSPSPTLPGPSLTQVKPESLLNETVVVEQVVAGSIEDAAPSFSISSQPPIPSPMPSKVKHEVNGDLEDLNDVLAAAQAAADSAELAAAAARAAASLAHVRITELALKKNHKLIERSGLEDLVNSSSYSFPAKQAVIENHSPESHSPHALHKSPPSEPESPFPSSYQSVNQPSRSPSMEDDPYYSYPNLFSRQSSDIRSPTGNSP